MKYVLTTLATTALFLTTAAFAASPTFLITHNETNEESNAFIAELPSPHPTKANSVNKVEWNLVRFACWWHTVNDKCTAEVKMATDTSHPISIGMVTLDLNTGLITPNHLSANGYSLTVNGLGDTTITYE